MTENESLMEKEGRYSGMVFWLNIPVGTELNLEILHDDLLGRTFHQSIADNIDEELFIPDIFRRDGEVSTSTTISSVQLVTTDEGSEILIGDIIFDETEEKQYRDNRILVLETTTVKFIIFEFSDTYYLALLNNRDSAEAVASIFKSKYGELGSAINPTRIGPEAIEDIRESLDANIKDTIISNYPQKEVSTVRMLGPRLEDHEGFRQEKSQGEITSYMLQTEELVLGEAKTVEISRDGLVRIYSNATIKTYLKLLTDHVLPSIEQDLESSPDMGAYEQLSTGGESSIYDRVEENG